MSKRAFVKTVCLKNILLARSFSYKNRSNSLLYETFRTRPRLETEAKLNSAMAYLRDLPHKLKVSTFSWDRGIFLTSRHSGNNGPVQKRKERVNMRSWCIARKCLCWHNWFGVSFDWFKKWRELLSTQVKTYCRCLDGSLMKVGSSLKRQARSKITALQEKLETNKQTNKQKKQNKQQHLWFQLELFLSSASLRRVGFHSWLSQQANESPAWFQVLDLPVLLYLTLISPAAELQHWKLH